ncbi:MULTISPECIES: hypothetical protein [Hymenobacter]|uniref:Uncharacterized protein n=1 Tax=Hymenobacter jejuensis TaxID=2502781 RepID=A0A5B7ZVK9_9BACT|nr:MULTISPECIES: hypothetical protein [Hymenobacter]MBC6988675.1 hypothetical protein [Hymenobacter sp. BT491]QDA59030.1 hypothetical protein FHG12_02440 [Hymenobacter jejuensis]
MSLFDMVSHLSSGGQLQEAQELLNQLVASGLTDEQQALVHRLRDLLDSLASNNTLGLFL